jgi:hypothetical protein
MKTMKRFVRVFALCVFWAGFTLAEGASIAILGAVISRLRGMKP